MKEYYYAQTDADGLCCGTSQLKGKVTADNLHAVTPELFETLVVGRSRLVNGEWIPDDPPAPPMDEVKAAKKQELAAAKEAALAAGIEIETSIGVKRFSLGKDTKSDLTGLNVAALVSPESMANGIPYHTMDDGHIFWSTEDFAAISRASLAQIMANDIYADALARYVDAQETVEAVQAIAYGMALPGVEM